MNRSHKGRNASIPVSVILSRPSCALSSFGIAARYFSPSSETIVPQRQMLRRFGSWDSSAKPSSEILVWLRLRCSSSMRVVRCRNPSSVIEVSDSPSCLTLCKSANVFRSWSVVPGPGANALVTGPAARSSGIRNRGGACWSVKPRAESAATEFVVVRCAAIRCEIIKAPATAVRVIAPARSRIRLFVGCFTRFPFRRLTVGRSPAKGGAAVERGKVDAEAQTRQGRQALRRRAAAGRASLAAARYPYRRRHLLTGHGEIRQRMSAARRRLLLRFRRAAG